MGNRESTPNDPTPPPASNSTLRDATTSSVNPTTPHLKQYECNGAYWPEEVPRSTADFNWPPVKDNIAAIDFGTTSCSVAYVVRGSSSPNLLNLSNGDPFTGRRVPNDILISAEGEVVEFGRNAYLKYHSLSSQEKSKLHFFHRIKMTLYYKEVSLSTQHSAFSLFVQDSLS